MTSSQPLLILTHTVPTVSAFEDSPRLSPVSLATVVSVHVALLAWLVLAPDVSESITPPRPLTVSLIPPEVPEPQPELRPEPKPEPPPPQPVAKPLPPPPVLVAERPQPTPEPVVEAPPPLPEPVPEALPPPPPPQPVVAVEVPRPAPPPPPPPTPPRAADYLNNPKPAYPALSRRLGEEGVVRLNILVNADGSVAQIELAQSSGHPRLDEAAMRTVQSSWRFEPARQSGRPVQAWVIVPIQFTLRS